MKGCRAVGLPRWLSGRESTSRCSRRPGFDSLGGEDALEEGVATHSSILAWRIPGQRSLMGYSPWGRRELDTTERLNINNTEAQEVVSSPSGKSRVLVEGACSVAQPSWGTPRSKLVGDPGRPHHGLT